MEKFLDKNGKSILIIILSVILFEVFICNFSFFESLFYKELNWLAFILSAGVVLLSHVFALASRE